MKIGDLVSYYDGLNDDRRIGLVTEVIEWKDIAAPDRNLGIDIVVLWTDGQRERYEPDELVIWNEDR